MSNKYTWVFFNLVASIGCFIYLNTWDIPEGVELGFISIFLVIGNIAWICQTVSFWRKCIQADDPALNKVLSSTEEEPDNKQAISKSKTDKSESLS